MISSNEPVGSFVVPSLPKKFVRCSVRTRVEHVQMLLRRKLTIPSDMQVVLSLPTAYVVRREGNVFTRVCPSIILSVHGGVPWPGPAGGGYPSQVQVGGGGTPSVLAGGTPARGVLHLGYSPSDLARGIPLLGGGTPPWIPPRSDLARGYPTLGTPHQTWPGGYPCQEGSTPPRVPPHQT